MQVVIRRRRFGILHTLIAFSVFLGFVIAPPARASVMNGIIPDANYAGLQLWLDVDSLPTNSTSISTWEDKSSNGFDATQGTLAAQPTYVASNPAFSGWASVHFDGSNDRLAAGSASAMSINGAQPRTIFVAFKQDALTSKNVVGYGADAGGQTFDLLPFGNNSVIIGHMYGGGFDTIGGTSQTYAANQLTVATINYNGSLVELYQHDQNFSGMINSKAMALNTSDSAIHIGAGNYSGYNVWNGDIVEVLIYDEVLSSLDRAAVDNYLFTKYSMTPEAFHLQFLPVPEPASCLLMLGILAFSLRRMKRGSHRQRIS